MNGAAARIYLVLAAHVGSDWTAYPSLNRLATLAGLRERSARRALRQLEQLNAVMIVERGGGHGKSSTYRLNTDPPVPLSKPETRTNGARKRGQTKPETRTNDARNPDTGVPPTEEQREQIKNKGGIGLVAAREGPKTDGQLSEANLALLAKHGVDANDRTRALAANPLLTPTMFHRVVGELPPGAGPGLIVEQLTKAVETERKYLADRTARREQVAREYAKLVKQRADFETQPKASLEGSYEAAKRRRAAGATDEQRGKDANQRMLRSGVLEST